MTVEEVLKWYGGDPEAYFSDLMRKVNELYKKHSLAQLKKEFRTTTVATIDKIFRKNNGLYVPSFRALKQHQAPKRKTRRPDHECGHPKEICLNFLKVSLAILNLLSNILEIRIFSNASTSNSFITL